MDQQENTSSAQGDEQNDSGQSAVTVVCNGATCYCSLSVANNSDTTAVPLTVTSQSRVDVNGGKAVATEKDNALANVNFNQCQPPGSSNPLPCNTQIKWDKMYEEVVINGDRLKILVEDSIGTCNANGAPGQVKIAKHGQQAQAIVRWHMENVDVYSMQKQFPFYRHTPPQNEELPMVSGISCATLDKTYDSTGPGSQAVTIVKVRPDQRLKFTVKKYSNKNAFNKSRTCWKLWEGFGFSRPKDIFENHGEAFEIDFDQPGKYRVLAYGSLDVQKQNSTSCSIDVEVVQNKIIAVEGDSKVAIHNASTYKLKTLLPDWQSTDGEIKWYIKHAANGLEQEGSATTIIHSFQHIGTYTITVYVNNELSVTKSITIGYNEIAGVSIAGSNISGTHKIRPGQIVQIQSRYKFAASDADITNLRWRYKPPTGPDVDYAAAAGKQLFTPEPALTAKGVHLFEAYRKDGKRYDLRGDDTISIQVVENTVKQLTWAQNNLKLGREITFAISEMEFPDLTAAELSNTWWLLSGPEPANAKRTKEFKHTFKKGGTYTLSCAIGTTTPKTASFTVAAPEITDAFWCDTHGSKLKSAGWEQEVWLTAKTAGLVGEKITIDVYDCDSTGDNVVYTTAITPGGSVTYDAVSIVLNGEIRKKVAAHGFTEKGELYIKCSIPAGDLIVKGIDKKWAKQLYVNEDKKVLACIIGTADGQKRHVMVDVNETSTVYVQTQGYIGKELEMHLRESVTGPDPEIKAARKKMKVERDGVVRFPLQWSVAKKDGQRKARDFYVEIWDGDDKIWDGDARGNVSLMVQMMPGTKIETAEGMEGVTVVERVNGAVQNANISCFCKEMGLVTTVCKTSIFKGIPSELYDIYAAKLGCEKEVIMAIGKQECGNEPFFLNDTHAKILYERHYMYRGLKKEKKYSIDKMQELEQTKSNIIFHSGYSSYGTYKNQVERLDEAKKIDADCAIQSCSWGRFQVMGVNYKGLYNTPQDLESAQNKCEIQHLVLFYNEVKDNSALVKAMKEKDWDKIAYNYNGPNWKNQNPDYSNNIKKFYNEYKK